MKKTMFFVAVSIAFLLITPIHVLAGPAGVLSGTYHLQGIDTCVQTQSVLCDGNNCGTCMGFQGGLASDYILTMPATTKSLSYEGTLVLNKDGTGEVPQLTIHQINHQHINAGDRPAVMWTGSCGLSYSYQSDDNYLLIFEVCNGGYVTTGGFRESGVEKITLKMTAPGSGDTLFLSTIDLGLIQVPVGEPYCGVFPPDETHKVLANLEFVWEGNINDVNDYYGAERLCNRSLTAVRVGR